MWSGQGALQMFRNLFQLFLPFAMIYYDSHNLQNFLKCISPKNTQHLLIVHMTLGLRESFLVLFSENKWQKNWFLRLFLVSRFVFLYSTYSCQLSGVFCCETAFAEQFLATRWLLRWQNFPSWLIFVWSYDSYFEPLLLSHGCSLPNLSGFC